MDNSFEREKEQTEVERSAVIKLCFILLLAAVFIAGTQPSNTFALFQKDFGDTFSPQLFAGLMLIAAILTPLLRTKRVRSLNVVYKRAFYRLCATPLILYTFPIGYVALQLKTGGLGAVLYVILFVYFHDHAKAVYRKYIT